MYFEYLNEKNHLMFAIKHYDNPQSVTVDDFMEDMKKFKYLKRLFKRYTKTHVLRTNLILNHLIILFNVFAPQECARVSFVNWHHVFIEFTPQALVCLKTTTQHQQAIVQNSKQCEYLFMHE